MSSHRCSIGHPWILDVLAKYETGNPKPKPVPAQVIEFVKMPDSASVAAQHPAAVVHISDRKYYIRAIITKEAKASLESENEHYTLADIKNKIVILKDFTLCFTELEDLDACEFYLTVRHFTILPMETNNVEVTNCNMLPGVQRRIHELWQNYMAELAMNENSSEVSLTQLLNIASEDNLNALKSLAEKCLDLDAPANHESVTKWGAESRENKNNTNKFTVPMNLLLIPPHEEAMLDQMAEFRNDGLTSDRNDNVDEDCNDNQSSSLSYITALSPQFEELLDDMAETQSGNPWNKLQSLCVSLSSGSASQAKESSSSIVQQSSEEEIALDPDSSTPDLVPPNLITCQEVPEFCDYISPLIFSNKSLSQEPSEEQESNTSKNVTHMDVAFNATLTCGQRKNVDSKNSPIIPVQKHSAPESELLFRQVQLSPLVSHSPDCGVTPRNIRQLVIPTKDIEEEHEIKNNRKAVKRKQASEDSDATLSDLESVREQPGSVHNVRVQEQNESKNNEYFGENETIVLETDDETDSMNNILLGERGEKEPDAYFQTGQVEQERVVRKINMAHSKPCGRSLAKRKPPLKFESAAAQSLTKSNENEVTSTEEATTSRIIPNEEAHTGGHSQAQTRTPKVSAPVIELNTKKLRHYDGTLFQYKYKLPSADLCDRVNSIRLPPDLCEWAVKILSEKH